MGDNSSLCWPPHTHATDAADGVCNALYCDVYLPYGGRSAFRIHQGVQGALATFLFLLLGERILRLLYSRGVPLAAQPPYCLCRVAVQLARGIVRVACCGGGSVQLVAFCTGLAIAIAEIIDSVDPDGWCGILPFAPMALLQDFASVLCINACALIMYSYFTVLSAVQSSVEGNAGQCYRCRRDGYGGLRPCQVDLGMWVLMVIVATIITGVSVATNLSGSAAFYAIGAGIVMPLALTSTIVLFEGLLLYFGVRIALTLRTMLREMRRADRSAEQSRASSSMHSRGQSRGISRNGSGSSLPNVARFGSRGQLAGRWFSLESDGDGGDEDRAAMAGGSVFIGESPGGTVNTIAVKSALKMPEGPEVTQLAAQIGRLHVSLALTALLSAGALFYCVVMFYRGSHVLHLWHLGLCARPFCHYGAGGWDGGNERATFFTYLSLLAPALLRLGVGTSLCFVFYRVRAPARSARGGQSGGGGEAEEDGYSTSHQAEDGGVLAKRRSVAGREHHSAAWAFEAESTDEESDSGWATVDSSFVTQGDTSFSASLASPINRGAEAFSAARSSWGFATSAPGSAGHSLGHSLTYPSSQYSPNEFISASESISGSLLGSLLSSGRSVGAFDHRSMMAADSSLAGSLLAGSPDARGFFSDTREPDAGF